MTTRSKYRRTCLHVWTEPLSDWSIRAWKRWHRVHVARQKPKWINGRLTKCRKARPEWLS